MTGVKYTGDFRLKIPCGEQFTKIFYFADVVDETTDPPTQTNPQDWSGWSSFKAGFTSGTDQTVSPLFEATVEINGQAVDGQLKLIITSAQSASLETGGYVHGRCDIFGHDPANAEIKVRKGVWHAEYSSTENF